MEVIWNPSEAPSELGGYREVIVRIDGDGAYGRLKYESGASCTARTRDGVAGACSHFSVYGGRNS